MMPWVAVASNCTSFDGQTRRDQGLAAGQRPSPRKGHWPQITMVPGAYANLVNGRRSLHDRRHWAHTSGGPIHSEFSPLCRECVGFGPRLRPVLKD